MDFFSSEFGVAIAWVCSVTGFIFGFIKNEEANQLKLEMISVKNENIEINNKVRVLKAKVIDSSKNDVSQTGEKNVYTKQVTGGMKINM
jgi:hypothetical protein